MLLSATKISLKGSTREEHDPASSQLGRNQYVDPVQNESKGPPAQELLRIS